MISLDKKKFRTDVRTKLVALSQEEHKKKSWMIHNKVINLDEIKNAQTIAVTISNFPEVDTMHLIEALWKMDKKVAVPRCDPKTRTMTFYIFDNEEQLETVYMDLKEPIPSKTKQVHAEEIDVIIAPGIVFDRSGYRIGYGGGYYDRYLAQYNRIVIAMAFDMQIVEKVPTDAYDLPVGKIITEEHIISCKEARREEQ